jgi:hypothetical protein
VCTRELRCRQRTGNCDHHVVIPRLIGLALLALLVAVVALAVARPEAFWSLDGPSLEASIEDEFGYDRG